MDVTVASFVRWIDPREPMDELVNDSKALTWEHNCEHAVVEVTENRRALVRGGRVGIEFVAEAGEPYDSSGKPTIRLFMDAPEDKVEVIRIVFHTHPMVTGPSDWDLMVLEMLRQRESRIYEINGPLEGTRIRPKK